MNEYAKTRAEAKNEGEKYYFTGKPCPQGHIDFRLTTSGRCYECSVRESSKGRTRKRNKAREARRQEQAKSEIRDGYADTIEGARERGDKYYFNGIPCKRHGHITVRMVSITSVMRVFLKIARNTEKPTLRK